MKRWLSPMIGATLLAALATAPVAHAWDWYSKVDGLKKAAAGLRKLAGLALPMFDQELTAEYTKQTSWLKNGASRCDALARKPQAGKGKDALGKAEAEFLNLRSALQKENGEFSFRSQQAKTRQQEANNILQALGQ